MARYDVYPSRREGQYLLDVQSDIIDDFGTRVVVPLLPARSAPRAMKRLHPTFNVEGRDMVMATQLLAAVPASELGVSVASLKARHDDIVAALDMLFQGF